MQPTLFPLTEPTGAELKQRGMDKAIQTVEIIQPGFSVKFYDYLVGYIRLFGPGHRFLAEDVRTAAERAGINCPASKRAIGSIMVKAKNKGLIQKFSTANVKNPKAHNANATMWEVV